MKISVVLFVSKNEVLEKAIQSAFQNNHMKVSELSWLISDDGTTKEISDKLGLSKGEAGSAIVMATNGYFGWAPNNIWEWLKTKLESP